MLRTTSCLVQVLALFANGRIEQWLDCICLSPADMSDPCLVPRIARHLRRFHSIQVDLSRDPHTPWGVIRDWLQQAQQLTFTDPVKQVSTTQGEGEGRGCRSVCLYPDVLQAGQAAVERGSNIC